MKDLITLLTEHDLASAESLAGSVEGQLLEAFGDKWGAKIDINAYSRETYGNLWRNELRNRIRGELESNGVDSNDFFDWLGEVHYVRVALYRKSLFATYKDNAGWRITLLGVPAVTATAIGIASHYQGGQAHIALAKASNVLYDVAKDGLTALSPPVEFPGRKVVRDDWDRGGLLVHPVTTVAGVDISEVTQGSGLWIGDVRNTTVKKMIASYISIDRLPGAADVKGRLDGLRIASEALAA